MLRIAMKSAFFILGVIIGVVLVYNIPHHHSQEVPVTLENSCDPVLQPYLSLD